MNTRTDTTRQATAFGLAALVTLTMLTSINGLATQPAVELQMARQTAPTQVVTVEAKRDARS